MAADVTLGQLQAEVAQVTGVKVAHQKLRVGFPPRVLVAPGNGGEGGGGGAVALASGDKITVEDTLAQGEEYSSFTLPASTGKIRCDRRGDQ